MGVQESRADVEKPHSNRDEQPEQATFCKSVVPVSGSKETLCSFLIVDQRGADTTDNLVPQSSLLEPT